MEQNKKIMRPEIIEMLKKREISVTIQRIGILEYLFNTKSHPTVEEIFSYIYSQYSNISRATVYNTLLLFKQEGIIQEITIEKEKARYDGNPMPHAHFYCKKCGKVYDVDIEQKIICPGYQVEEHQIYLYGKCPHCQEK